MRISVIAVGRMKAGPEQTLAERYFERFGKGGGSVGLDFAGVVELTESRARSADERRRDEGRRLREQLPPGAVLYLLDERGKDIASEELASRIGVLRDGGQRHLAVAIGGPDGHDPALRGEAGAVISFGSQTWPHQMVRIMLAEQLYRISTILSGHPYHRA